MRVNELLVIVPARGGSTRLRRKNLLPIDGKPLFLHAAGLARRSRVVVSTDDDEIAAIARTHGYEVHRRNTVPADQTIAQMADMVVNDLAHPGPVLVIQPTAYPLDYDEVAKMLESPDTAVGSTLDKHRYWPGNSRGAWPEAHREVGVYFYPSTGKVGQSPRVHYQLTGTYDIDYPTDLMLAAHHPRDILIEAAGPERMSGTGHQRRMETLALALQHHNVTFVTDGVSLDTELFIRDAGDSTENTFAWFRSMNIPTLAFEDSYSHADVTINAFGSSEHFSPMAKLYSGGKYAILRSEFLALPRYNLATDSDRVMVLFGGSDSRELTDWASTIVRREGLTPISYVGPGVAEAMLDSRLVITGGGQLVQEAAAVGAPCISIAQNMREASHRHLGHRYGNMYLGLFSQVSESAFRSAVECVADDPVLRREMHERSHATVDGRGLERVVFEIERMLRFGR